MQFFQPLVILFIFCVFISRANHDFAFVQACIVEKESVHLKGLPQATPTFKAGSMIANAGSSLDAFS